MYKRAFLFIYTLGGTGPSLTDLIEEGVGNGKGQSPSLSFEELFMLLLSEEVRNKVAWIANLPVKPVAVKALKAVGAAGKFASHATLLRTSSLSNNTNRSSKDSDGDWPLPFPTPSSIKSVSNNKTSYISY